MRAPEALPRVAPCDGSVALTSVATPRSRQTPRKTSARNTSYCASSTQPFSLNSTKAARDATTSDALALGARFPVNRRRTTRPL